MVYGQKVVEDVAVNYFKDIFCSQNDTSYTSIADYGSVPQKLISSDQAVMLSAPLLMLKFLKFSPL